MRSIHVILSGRGDRRQDDHFFTAFWAQCWIVKPHFGDEPGPVFLFDLVELTVFIIDAADIFGASLFSLLIQPNFLLVVVDRAP